MRKKTVKNLCDQIFWYIIYTLPIILTICVCLGAFQGDWFYTWSEIDNDSTNLPFYSVLYNFLNYFGFDDGNWLCLAIDNVMIVAGIEAGTFLVPMFMAYFITTVILHVFVDFILFIPRLAHKWMNKLYKED